MQEDKKENKQSSTVIPKPLFITFVITTSSLPIFYLIGYLFDAGYLSAYGLNSEYFPRDAQIYYVNADIWGQSKNSLTLFTN